MTAAHDRSRGEPVHSFVQTVASGLALVVFVVAVLMWVSA